MKYPGSPASLQGFVVGIDGCKAGWLAVYLNGGTDCKIEVFEKISSLWNQYKGASLMLVDIPIGLPLNGSSERECDKSARRLLGQPRGSSVFPVPCRGAVYANLANASDVNNRLTGKSLSKQTLGIIQKIREVDEFLIDHSEAQVIMKEVHPELCFWALNGGRPMLYSKKKQSGLSERKRVLRESCLFTDNLIECALAKYKGKVKEDDILDALIAAVTASLNIYGPTAIPEPPEIDSKGLTMQMVYKFKPA